MNGMKIVPYKDSLLQLIHKLEAGILTDYYKDYYVTSFLNAFQINVANDVTECLTKGRVQKKRLTFVNSGFTPLPPPILTKS